MQTYLVTFQKQYRDAFQGDGEPFGKTYEYKDNVTHRIENVKETDLPKIMTQLLAKQYTNISINKL